MLAATRTTRASASGWPADVKLLVAKIGESAGQGDRIATVLGRHHANAVVICFFSMYTGGTDAGRAPAQSQGFFREAGAATLAPDPRFRRAQGWRMAVITKRE